MATKQDKIRSLELTVDEQRRDADLLERLNEHAKTKNITFIAASLALLIYLYTGSNNKDDSLRDKLFLPHEAYGVIIYVISLSLFIAGLVLLFIAMRPFPWSTAYDVNQEEYVPLDYEVRLKFYKKRYDQISTSNCKSYVTKQKFLNISFILLLAGGILLVVLKTFRG